MYAGERNETGDSGSGGAGYRRRPPVEGDTAEVPRMPYPVKGSRVNRSWMRADVLETGPRTDEAVRVKGKANEETKQSNDSPASICGREMVGR